MAALPATGPAIHNDGVGDVHGTVGRDNVGASSRVVVVFDERRRCDDVDHDFDVGVLFCDTFLSRDFSVLSGSHVRKESRVYGKTLGTLF